MATITKTMSAGAALRACELRIKVTGQTALKIRAWVAVVIMKLAAIVLGVKIQVELGERVREVRTERNGFVDYLYVADIDGELVDLLPFGNRLPD